MKKFMRYDYLSGLERYNDFGPLALRLVVGMIFAVSGYGKLIGIAGVTGFFGTLGIPLPGFFAWVVALGEFIGGLALILGIGTRYFAALEGFIMVVALVLTKFPKFSLSSMAAFSEWLSASRLDWLILAAAIALVVGGGGRYSLERKLCKK